MESPALPTLLFSQLALKGGAAPGWWGLQGARAAGEGLRLPEEGLDQAGEPGGFKH